jgi:pimeloyl-ACP methyl ester carboxylesterase
MTANVEHSVLTLNGIELHIAHRGAGAKRLMVFLHGFPQSWYAFRHQLAAFGDDYHAVAMDLRGFNRSGKPHGLWNYSSLAGASDVRALIDHLGYEKVTLVGHDWGAAVAWVFAFEYPQLLDRLVILSTAHPALFDRALREDAEQQRASQYLLSLRRRDSAARMRHEDYAILRSIFAPFTFFTESDRKEYLEGWSMPGSLEGGLAWYQWEALGPAEGTRPARGDYAAYAASQTVKARTLVIYGDHDAYTRPASHRGLEAFVPNLRFEVLSGASHWLAEEQPEVVNRLIKEFSS